MSTFTDKTKLSCTSKSLGVSNYATILFELIHLLVMDKRRFRHCYTGALQFPHKEDASLWFLSVIRRRNPITAHHEEKKKGGQCFTIPPMSQVRTASCCCSYDSEILYVWLNNNFKPILTPVGKLFPTWQVFYVKIASVLIWLQPYFILTATNTTYAPFLLSHGLLRIAKHKNITTWIIHRSQNLCG